MTVSETFWRVCCVLSASIALVDTWMSGSTYCVLVFAFLAASPRGVFCSRPPNFLIRDGFLASPSLVFILVFSGPVASSFLKPMVDLCGRLRRGGTRLR